MELADGLLDQAEHLAKRDDRGRPSQANLRRAVSAAYYALFHEVVYRARLVLLGGELGKRALGDRLGRSIDHANVKKAANWYVGTMPEAIKDTRQQMQLRVPSADFALVCRRLVELQESRHRADYDLSIPLLRPDAKRLIEEAREALQKLRGLPDEGDVLVLLLGCILGERFTKHG